MLGSGRRTSLPTLGVDRTSTGRDAISLAEMLRGHDGRLILAHVVLAQGPIYRNFHSAPAGKNSLKLPEREAAPAGLSASFTGMFAPSLAGGLRSLRR